MVAKEPDQPDSNGAAEEETSDTSAEQHPDAGRAGAAEAELMPARPTPAGQFIGFGAMLKRWRKAAGVTQPRAARALGISERKLRGIESGATPRFTQEQCDALVELLQLDSEDRHALLLHNVGTYLRSAEGQPEVGPALRLLIDQQMPSPTYLSDRNWNILAYNTAMAETWPWVMEPKANLIRWALTTAEGRATYHDWHKHATVFVRMLRFAETTHGDDPNLQELIEDVKKNPEVLRIWESDTDFVEHRDGHVFLATVPTLDYRTIEIVSHVAYPAIMPDCRFVVMTWVEAGAEVEPDAQRDALGGVRDAWADETHNGAHERDRALGRIAEADRLRAEDLRTARLLVSSAAQAAAQAGEDAIPLPALSRLMGPDAQLTLSPSKRSVFWAVEESAGQWGVTEVAPTTVIARVPRKELTGERLVEMKQLVRLALPAEPEAAAARIEQLLSERDVEQRILRDILAELPLPGSDPPNSHDEAA
ncbi:helix-turn-helix transcriptional regulator [Streptomyces sp. G44]|uniref:helix-turn-helix transcriptional regulator n=1 Tax=Streptomyces sp. G44 TaxID=2807632 RepID=UPI001EF90961|nr:helix-turn-helix transcriptional regulator [Streptomyces sp. G44]